MWSTFGRWCRQNVHETEARARFHIKFVRNCSDHFWKTTLANFIDSLIHSIIHSINQSFMHAMQCNSIQFKQFNSVQFNSCTPPVHSVIHSFTHSFILAMQCNSAQLSSVQVSSIVIPFSSMHSFQFTSCQLTNNSYKQTGSYSNVQFLKLPPRRVPGTFWYKQRKEH